MKRARDVRDQLAGLMERVEIEPTSNPSDTVAIRKVRNDLNLKRSDARLFIRSELVNLKYY